MNLPMRQNKKRNQALDAFASVAKTWSEWRLGERAAQSVATGTKKASKAAAKARKRAGKSDSGVKAVLKSTPVRIAGAAALVGGVGAAVAKKLKGGGTAEPLYTPPPAPAPMDPPDGLKDAPAAPSTGIVVGDLDASESAVASSEKAVAAATSPPPSGTEPTVPDTDPDTDTDQDITAAGTDEGTVAQVDGAGVDAAGDDRADSLTEEAAVSADADPDELESAPAGDAHGDDAPTIPADSDKS